MQVYTGEHNESTVFKRSDGLRFTHENTENESTVFKRSDGLRLHMRTQKMSELFSSEVMVLGVTLQITDNE